MAELRLVGIWRQALKDRAVNESDWNHLRTTWGGELQPKEGDNRRAVAAACAKLAGRSWPWQVPLDDIETHQRNWAPNWGPETWSPLYAGWWAGAMGTLLGPSRWWQAAKPWLVGHALAAGSVPTEIRLKTHLNTSSRRVAGDTAWRWGSRSVFSIHPAERMLWSDPISDSSPLIQRAVTHPLVSLAVGKPVRITEWDHGSYGLPLRALLNRSPRRPEAWGEPLGLGREARRHLMSLPPLPGNSWVRYKWYTDGSRAVAISHGRTGTRGTIPLAVMRDRVVTYYTTAQDSGGGTWTRPNCQDRGSDWLIQSSSGHLQVGQPELELGILWDSSGARIEGESPQDPPVDRKDPELLRLLAAISPRLVGAPNEQPCRNLLHHVLLLNADEPGNVDVVRRALKGVIRSLS